MKESEVVVHPSTITIHIWNSLKLVPRARFLCNQQPLWHDIATPCDTLKQSATTKAVIVSAESVILKHEGKRL